MMVLRKSLVLAVFAAAIVAMVSASALAQPGGRRGRDFGGFGGRGGRLGLLRDPAIRAEMEIVEDQEKELEKIREEVSSTFREMFSEMRKLPEDKRREAFGQMREKMAEAMKDIEKKVDGVLIPAQKKRLDELALQSRVRRSGAEGALASEELAKELGITEKQKKRLQEVALKVQKELQGKIEKLRQEARDEILEVLTPQQRGKLTEMLGKQFTRPPRDDDRRRGPRG